MTTKNNIKSSRKRKPGLLRFGRIETHYIPPSIKQKAKGRRIHVWTRPFKCGLSMATDEIFSENPEEVAFNQRLTKTQLEVINRVVGSENMSHIKSCLIQNCNVPNPTKLTWREILAHLEVYLHSQKAKQPAETEQKEIVEVKPSAFGITVNIKEIAKHIWKCVCSRSKD